MVPAADVAQPLFLDDLPEMIIGLVDRFMVSEGVANGDDAGAVGQRLDPFRHQFLARFGRGGGAARLQAIVDKHVGHDVVGERIVGAVDRALDDAPELVEVAGVGGEPNPVGS